MVDSLSTEDPAFTRHLIVDDRRQEMKGLFFQTGFMKSRLQKYPKILFVDGTYCTNRYGLPLCFLVADGERHGQPVGYALVRDETSATIKDVMKAFIVNNEEACAQVTHAILDKDCGEISGYFPLPMSKSAGFMACRYLIGRSPAKEEMQMRRWTWGVPEAGFCKEY